MIIFQKSDHVLVHDENRFPEAKIEQIIFSDCYAIKMLKNPHFSPFDRLERKFRNK